MAGRNVAIENIVSDLVRRLPTLLVATGRPSVLAIKVATTTIPIVFGVGGHPVQLNRPGGNVTNVKAQSGPQCFRELLLHFESCRARSTADHVLHSVLALVHGEAVEEDPGAVIARRDSVHEALDGKRDYVSSSSNALASFRTGVSRPSVNPP